MEQLPPRFTSREHETPELEIQQNQAGRSFHGQRGLTNARTAYKMAELFNVPCTVISSVELGISTSAAMMFAASLKTLEYACEASGMMTISDDVVREPLVIKDGFAEVPTGIGLGAELDEQKIEKYSEGAITCK